jgi:hypothetical protein
MKIDLILNNQEFKKIIQNRINELEVETDVLAKDSGMKEKDLLDWLMNDEMTNISHEKIVDVANNLAIEMKLKIIKHELSKSKYSNE